MASPKRTVIRCVAAVAVSGLLALSACSSSNQADPSPTTSMVVTTTEPRPAGPVADMSSELSGGNGVIMGESTPPDLPSMGYVQSEFLATGDATSYKVDGALTGDGRWSFVPDASAPYRTRVVVRAPEDPAAFSGNVLVEWLNVSGGVDADPEWTSTQEEIARAGDVWVGVSAQRIGVEGGPTLTKLPDTYPGADLQGKGLKAVDPERYGTLSHPGDNYSSDIYTQVARAVREGAGMSGLTPQRVIAAGESQSAFALVSYYNGVQPLTHAFDGFFVHSRGAIGLPFATAGPNADIASAISGTPTIFRTDQRAPVMDIQTETDVASILNSYAARQTDSDQFRLWEVAGTAHADAHLVGATAQYLDCGLPINDGPMHIVAKAALRSLTTWLTSGTPPPTAPRLEVQPGPPPQVARDADGIAVGGIRTPPVDVPVTVLSGEQGPKPSPICTLSGSESPLPVERLAQLYPSSAEYLERYQAGADAAIQAGFVLPEDRDALLAYADPSAVPG